MHIFILKNQHTSGSYENSTTHTIYVFNWCIISIIFDYYSVKICLMNYETRGRND